MASFAGGAQSLGGCDANRHLGIAGRRVFRVTPIAGRIWPGDAAGGQVIIPAPVADEIRQREASDPTVRALQQTESMEIVEAPVVPPLIQAWDLGPGEASVLAYAYEKQGTVAVIDDLAGRRCAEALKIPVNGTLGLVLIAKKRGLIPAAQYLAQP